VAAGVVMVLVDSTGGHSPPIVFGPTIVDGLFVVRFAGVPGLTYTIEYTDGLAPANWRKHSNVTAPAEGGSLGAGVFEVRQAITEQPARFFRIKYPAY
jgi:hypothetical protein